MNGCQEKKMISWNEVLQNSIHKYKLNIQQVKLDLGEPLMTTLEKILIQEKYKHPWDLEDAEPTEDDFTGRFSDEPEEDEEYHHHKHKKHKDNFDLENPDKNLFEMGQEDLYEYGEEKEPDPAEQDLDLDDDDFSDWDGGELEGDDDDSNLEGDDDDFDDGVDADIY